MKKILSIIFGITLALSVVVSVQAQTESNVEGTGKNVFQTVWSNTVKVVEWMGNMAGETGNFGYNAIRMTVVDPVIQGTTFVWDSFSNLVDEVGGRKTKVVLRRSAPTALSVTVSDGYFSDVPGVDCTTNTCSTMNTEAIINIQTPTMLFDATATVASQPVERIIRIDDYTYQIAVRLTKGHKLTEDNPISFVFHAFDTLKNEIILTEKNLETPWIYVAPTFSVIAGEAFSSHKDEQNRTDVCFNQLYVQPTELVSYTFKIDTSLQYNIEAYIAGKKVEAISMGQGKFTISQVMQYGDWKDKQGIPVKIKILDALDNTLLGELNHSDFNGVVFFYNVFPTQLTAIESVSISSTPPGVASIGFVEQLTNLLRPKEEQKVLKYNFKPKQILYMTIKANAPLANMKVRFNDMYEQDSVQEIGQYTYLVSWALPEMIKEGAITFVGTTDPGISFNHTTDLTVAFAELPIGFTNISISTKGYNQYRLIACIKPADGEVITLDHPSIRAMQQFCDKTIPDTVVGFSNAPGASISFAEGGIPKNSIYALVADKQVSFEIVEEGQQVLVTVQTNKQLSALPEMMIAGGRALVTQVNSTTYIGVVTINPAVNTVVNLQDIKFTVTAPEVGTVRTPNTGRVVYKGKEKVIPELEPFDITLVKVYKEIPDIAALEESDLRAVSRIIDVNNRDSVYVVFQIEGAFTEFPILTISKRPVSLRPFKDPKTFIGRLLISEALELEDQKPIEFSVGYKGLEKNVTTDGSFARYNAPEVIEPPVVTTPTVGPAPIARVGLAPTLLTDNVRRVRVILAYATTLMDTNTSPTVNFVGSRATFTPVNAGGWTGNQWRQEFETKTDENELNTVLVTSSNAKDINGVEEGRSTSATLTLHTANPFASVSISKQNVKDSQSDKYNLVAIYDQAMDTSQEPSFIFDKAVCTTNKSGEWTRNNGSSVFKNTYTCNTESAIEVKVTLAPKLVASETKNIEESTSTQFVVVPIGTAVVAAPIKLISAHIESTNTEKRLAKSGDTITLTFALEGMLGKTPRARLLNMQPSEFTSVNGPNAQNIYTMGSKILFGDREGPVSFEIEAVGVDDKTYTFKDVTDGSKVTIDTTAPRVSGLAFTALSDTKYQLIFNVDELLEDEPHVTVNGTSTTTITKDRKTDRKIEYTATGEIQVNEETFTVEVTKVEDLAGNEADRKTLAVNNTVSPSVVHVTPSIERFNKKSGEQTLIVEFNKNMKDDLTNIPIFSFVPSLFEYIPEPDVDHWNGKIWEGTFKYIGNENETSIGVTIANAVDANNNTQTLFNLLDLFRLDTKPPKTTITVTGTVTNSSPTVSVVAKYNEKVKADKIPNLTLKNETHFTMTSGTWVDLDNEGFATEWHAIFTHASGFIYNFNNEQFELHSSLVDAFDNAELTATSNTFVVNTIGPNVPTVKFSETVYSCNSNGLTVEYTFFEAMNTDINKTPSLNIITTPSSVLNVAGDPQWSNNDKTLTFTISQAPQTTVTGKQITFELTGGENAAGNPLTGTITNILPNSSLGDYADQLYDGKPNGVVDLADVITLFDWFTTPQTMPDWVVGCFDVTGYNFDNDKSYELLIQQQQPNGVSDIHDLRYFFLNRLVNTERFPISALNN